MSEQLNTNDTCPCCKTNWDGGDIRRIIGNLDIHQFTDVKKLDALAAEFGWTLENQKRFSKVKTYQMKPELDLEHIYAECNECGKVFRMSDSKQIGYVNDMRGLYENYQHEEDQEE